MKTMFKYILISVFVFFVEQSALFSQNYIRNIEEINIITDRDLYLTGENLWYTAHYSMKIDSEPLSAIIYVELFDNNLNLIESQKVTINSGLSNGMMILPEHLPTGYYILRAYTRYQQNFPSWQFETKIVRVVNTMIPLPKVRMPDNNEIVVYGIMPDSRLSFYVSSAIYNKVDSIYLIVDGKKSNSENYLFNNGLGFSSHIPKANEILKLGLILNTGDTLVAGKFKAKDRVSPILISEEDNWFEINIVDSLFKQRFSKIEVIDILVNETLSNLKNSDFVDNKFVIDKSLLTSGLLKVTSFENDGHPIYTTMLYNAKDVFGAQTPFPDITVNKNAPLKIDLPLKADSQNQYLVSIALEGTNSSNNNILPDFLIANPQYAHSFFKGKEMKKSVITQMQIATSIFCDKLSENLDNQITNDKIPELFGLTIQGRLLDNENNRPVRNELVYCSVLGENPQFHTSTTNNNGVYVFNTYPILNKADIFIVTANNDSVNSNIVVDNGFYTDPPLWSPVDFSPDSLYSTLLTAMYLNKQISEVYNVERIKKVNLDYNVKPVFANNLTTIKLSDYVQLSSTPEVFNEIVPYVRARKRDEKYNLLIIDDILNIRYDNPLLLVDDILITDIDGLMSVQPTVIDEVKVASHSYYYGNQFFNGIVSVRTNTQNFAGISTPTNGVFAEFEGISERYLFKPPSDISANLPDYCNTLFWDVISSSDNSNPLVFRSPDNVNSFNMNVIDLKTGEVVIKQKIIVRNN